MKVSQAKLIEKGWAIVEKIKDKKPEKYEIWKNGELIETRKPEELGGYKQYLNPSRINEKC